MSHGHMRTPPSPYVKGVFDNLLGGYRGWGTSGNAWVLTSPSEISLLDPNEHGFLPYAHPHLDPPFRGGDALRSAYEPTALTDWKGHPNGTPPPHSADGDGEVDPNPTWTFDHSPEHSEDGGPGEVVLRVTNFAGHVLLPLVFRADVEAATGLGVYVGGQLASIATSLVLDAKGGVLADQKGVGGCVDAASAEGRAALKRLARLATSRGVRHNLDILFVRMPAAAKRAASPSPSPAAAAEATTPVGRRGSASPSPSRAVRASSLRAAKADRQRSFERLHDDARARDARLSAQRHAARVVEANVVDSLKQYSANRVRLRDVEALHSGEGGDPVQEAGLEWTRARRRRTEPGRTVLDPALCGSIQIDLERGGPEVDAQGNVLVLFDDGTEEYWPPALLVIQGNTRVGHESYERLGFKPKPYQEKEVPPEKLKDVIHKIHGEGFKWDGLTTVCVYFVENKTKIVVRWARKNNTPPHAHRTPATEQRKRPTSAGSRSRTSRRSGCGARRRRRSGGGGPLSRRRRRRRRTSVRARRRARRRRCQTPTTPTSRQTTPWPRRRRTRRTKRWPPSTVGRMTRRKRRVAVTSCDFFDTTEQKKRERGEC